MNEQAPIITGLASGIMLVLAFVLFLPHSPSLSNNLPEIQPSLWIVIQRQPDGAIQSGAMGQFWLILRNESEFAEFPSLRKAITVADAEEGTTEWLADYPAYVVKADDLKEGDNIVREIQDRSTLVYHIGNDTYNKTIHVQFKHQYQIILVKNDEKPNRVKAFKRNVATLTSC